jgi:uncharacterized protein YaaQ
MKLLIAIIRDEDNDKVSGALTENGFRVTFIASTGGFFRSGRATLFIGLEESRLEQALELIRNVTSEPKNPNEHKATIFVLDVQEFVQL